MNEKFFLHADCRLNSMSVTMSIDWFCEKFSFKKNERNYYFEFWIAFETEFEWVLECKVAFFLWQVSLDKLYLSCEDFRYKLNLLRNCSSSQEFNEVSIRWRSLIYLSVSNAVEEMCLLNLNAWEGRKTLGYLSNDCSLYMWWRLEFFLRDKEQVWVSLALNKSWNRNCIRICIYGLIQ